MSAVAEPECGCMMQEAWMSWPGVGESKGTAVETTYGTALVCARRAAARDEEGGGLHGMVC